MHDHDVPPEASLTGELDRGLVRLGAGVAEEHLAVQARPRQALGQAHRGLGVEQVADVHQPLGLLAHRRHHARVTVTDVRDRDAAEEIEVLVAVLVPQMWALPANELHGEARVRSDHTRTLELLQLSQAHVAASILVPIPASVNSSKSNECGVRPSRMCAALTPWWIASRQACNLGRIPPCRLSSESSTSFAEAWAIRLPGSVGSRSQPGTSVRKITFCAPIAPATAPAASSALTL